MANEHDSDYNEQFVAWLEWVWGEGAMSPGGAEEVAAILGEFDIRGLQVLDIGSGLGTVDVILVRQHGAAHVTGIDIEAPTIARANKRIIEAGLASQITFQLVTPGRLPFDDHSFDVVFHKDVMMHVVDKAAMYNEIYRVLKPGGYVAFSDWFGSDLPDTPEYREWLDESGLTFKMDPIGNTVDLMRQIGFVDIEQSDRNAWYAQLAASELAAVQSENFDQVVAEQGFEFAQLRQKMTILRKTSVDQGRLRPGHIRARRPH